MGRRCIKHNRKEGTPAGEVASSTQVDGLRANQDLASGHKCDVFELFEHYPEEFMELTVEQLL